MKYPLRESFIFACRGSQDVDCCLQTTDFLEEVILTREKSCDMFDSNTCWLRSRMVVWDLFNFKMYLLIMKVKVFLQESQQIQYII